MRSRESYLVLGLLGTTPIILFVLHVMYRSAGTRHSFNNNAVVDQIYNELTGKQILEGKKQP
jgi:hypothetical protein